jgi:hypothetical protein
VDANDAAQIIAYRHADKRVNNPEVGMVTPATDPEVGKNRWAYDPHLDLALRFDPQRARLEALIDDALASERPSDMREALQELKRLQSPYLAWAGKAERTSFDVDTVSLHVHERIDPASILSAVRKDIDAIKGITALKAQMNTDLLTEDLKKARTSNQSFWLMGQPEVEVRKTGKADQWVVEVHGFDYFDTVKGELVSGGKNKIAMWALDTDYDERSLFPRQVFFPMAGKGEGWEKLKKDIRAELDESLLQAFHGTVSLPFAAGDNRKVAVKIVDDRGIESLKVMNLEG